MSKMDGISSKKKSLKNINLSGHVPEIQAEVEVVKIKNPDSCMSY